MSIPPIDDNTPNDATLSPGNAGLDNVENKAVPSDEANIIEKDQTENIQLAMAGPVRKTVVDAAGDVIKKYTDKDGNVQDKADVIVSPNKKKADKELKAGADKLDDGGGEAQSLANVDESGNVIFRSATPDELTKLQKFAQEGETLPLTDKKAMKKLKIATPNLKRVESGEGKDADESLRSLIFATYSTYKEITTASGQRIIRTGERGFKQVIQEANTISSVDAFLMLMQRQPGERPFTDAEFLAARRTVVALQLEAQRLVKIAQKTGDPLDKARAAQAIGLEGYASIQLFGAQGDAARSLATFRIIASPSKARIQAMGQMLDKTGVLTNGEITQDNLIDYIEAYGGEGGIDQLLYYYSIAPNDRTRHEFAKRSIIRKYIADPFVEIYQSALLSNPITHTYNFLGQAVMLELQVLERALEGRPLEALAMLQAQKKYIGDAVKASWHALKTEKSVTDGTSKLDVDMKAISSEAFGIDRKAGKVQSAAGFFVDGFGQLMRLQGYRPMVAIDEGFKVLSRGMFMEGEAVKAKIAAIKSAKARGLSPDKVTEEGQAAYLKTLHSQETFDGAVEFGKYVTFQDDLPGVLGSFQGALNHPLMKIWMPFYKTPTNIMLRILERTPLGIAMPSNMKKMLMGSNAERRAMMSKIVTGTGLGALMLGLTTGSYGDGIMITGYGPRRKKQRANWLENHEPYSIGIKKEDGSYAWVSYARFDPLSGVLALAADTADVMYNVDDPEALDDMVLNLGIATTRYVGSATPMLQFVGELLELQGSPYADAEKKLERLQEIVSKQAVTAGIIVKEHITTGGQYGVGMQSLVERVTDPSPKETKPNNLDQIYPHLPGVQGLDATVRGAYEALTLACSKTIGCSDSLPDKTNRWGEVVPQTRGSWWNYWAPVRIVDKPQKNIVNKELELLMTGLPPLARSMNTPNIKLTGVAYADYKKYYNDPASSPLAKEVFGNTVMGSNLMPKPILEAYAELFDSDDYKYIPTPGVVNKDGFERMPASKGHKLRKIQEIDNIYKNYAKLLVLSHYPEYATIVSNQKAYQENLGVYPNTTLPPTKNETNQTILEIEKKLPSGLPIGDKNRALEQSR